MSSGISDARAEDRLANNVWYAAFDLQECVAKLAKAIKAARMGHRGWAIARVFIVREINGALNGTGFKLIDEDPNRGFEYYE